MIALTDSEYLFPRSEAANGGFKILQNVFNLRWNIYEFVQKTAVHVFPAVEISFILSFRKVLKTRSFDRPARLNVCNKRNVNSQEKSILN